VTQGVESGFESNRARLFGLAYRMLGSRAEAEDLVQDAYLRWHQTDRQAIRNAEAWLVTTTTRLAIDRLRALKTERDAYAGPWLPEPMMHDTAPAPDRHLELASDLSIAFLVLLERLAPEERAAFLLHDVFDFEYAEVASALDKTEDACRQMVHRARTRVRSERKRFVASDADKSRLLEQFRRAVNAGDQQALLELFTPDAVWTADGGGRVPAAGGRPILGADRIARLVLGFRDRLRAPGASVELLTINGETGLCLREHGRISALISIATDGERIHEVYAVLNPEKLPQD
jgi:RNA polymerase sigma-70 factor (ECF subfamily)